MIPPVPVFLSTGTLSVPAGVHNSGHARAFADSRGAIS